MKALYLVIIVFFISCGGRETALIIQNPTDGITIKPFFSLTNSSYKTSKGMEKILINDINHAEKNIRLAMYGFSNDRLRDAVISAHKRGIDTKIVTDDSQASRENIRLLKEAGIEVVDDQDSSSLMHNKFLVLDQHIVWTGSANYSYYSFYKNNENMVKITGEKPVNAYLHEFDEMYNHHYKEGAYISQTLEIYFSPEDDFEQRLLELIEHASYSIDFLAYAFTNKNIANALIKKAKSGVTIRGVFDKKWNKNSYSQYSNLLKKGIDVKLDGNKQTMHNKVFIIDDKLVVTGSYNFTEKANKKNNENSLVVHNEEFAARYEDEFQEIYNLGE